MLECQCGELIATMADWRAHFERCPIVADLSVEFWDIYVDFATLDAQQRTN